MMLLQYNILKTKFFRMEFKQKKIIFSGVLLLLLIGFVCIVSLLQINKTSDTYLVYRTNDGFSPTFLVVQMGDVVTFVNTSDHYFWPASDMHPSHNIYSEFDPTTAIAPGEEWSFKFKKIGKWAFHDHLESHRGGMISVISKKDNMSDTDCVTQNDKTDENCWNILITNVLEKEGLGSAYEVLMQLHALNPQSFPTICHPMTHDMGLKTYRFYGIDMSLFIEETGICNAGFYHGFMEGVLNDGYDEYFANEFCTKVGSILNTSFFNAENQCRHGIGHGMAESIIKFNPQLWGDPSAIIDEILQSCEKSNHTNDQLMRCVSGGVSVVADWLLSESEYKTFFTVDNIFNECVRLEKEYAKEGCYWEMAKRLRMLYDKDQEQVLRQIPKVIFEENYEKYVELALRSASSRIGKAEVYGSDIEIVNLCRSISEELQIYCIEGATDGLFSAGTPYAEEKRVLEFCASDLLHEDEQMACYKTIQRRVPSTYALDRLKNVCLQTPAEYRISQYCGDGQ